MPIHHDKLLYGKLESLQGEISESELLEIAKAVSGLSDYKDVLPETENNAREGESAEQSEDVGVAKAQIKRESRKRKEY